MRLIVSNIYEGNPNAHGSLEELARWEPDVVALIEAEAEGTDIAVRALFPIEEYSSRVYVRTGEGNPHFVVLSKHHLSDIEATFPDDVGGMPIVEWRQRLGVESAPVRFLLVHPPAPTTPRSTRQWLNYLCAIEENALRDDEPLVVLGDFNATMGHAPFRRLVSKMAGTDVFAGRGTWPQRWIELGLSPFPGMSKLPVPNYLLGLDHVITRGVPLARGWAIPTVGSDHASLLVDFPHYARLVD